MKKKNKQKLWFSIFIKVFQVTNLEEMSTLQLKTFSTL